MNNYSEQILEVMAINKCGVREAFDIVLGKGAFAYLADKLYDELRGKAAA